MSPIDASRDLVQESCSQAQELLPDANLAFRKSDASISRDFVPMLKVTAPSPTLKWDLKLLADKGMNKQNLHEAISTGLNAPDQNITWG